MNFCLQWFCHDLAATSPQLLGLAIFLHGFFQHLSFPHILILSKLGMCILYCLVLYGSQIWYRSSLEQLPIIWDALSMITINLKSDYITSLLFWTKTCVISRIWLILGSGIINSSQWLFLWWDSILARSNIKGNLKCAYRPSHTQHHALSINTCVVWTTSITMSVCLQAPVW